MSESRESKGRSRSPMIKKEGGGGGGRRAPPERRVFISNIPFEMKWQEVKDMFRKEIGDVTYVELFNDEHEKPRGCGILEFADEDLAKKAIEKMHRVDLKGRKLVVKEDFDTQRDKYGRIISNRSSHRDRSPSRRRDNDRDRGRDGRSRNDRNNDRHRSNNSGGGDYGNTYGLSPQFLDSLGIDGPLQNRVFVANLSYTVDEPKLKEVFRLAGKVVTVDLNRDKNGKSRGFGVVEYNHVVEAVQAISMFNDQMLFDRRMTVRFDNQAPDEPEESLPSRLPEGLGGVGMGLGSGGNPLTDVARNLPSLSNVGSSNMGGGGGGSSGLDGNVMAALAGAAGNSNNVMGGGGGNSNAMNLDFMSNVAKLVNTMGFLTNNSNNSGNSGGNMNMGGNPGGNNMNMGGGGGGNMGMMGQNMGGGGNMGGGPSGMNENRNIGGYSTGGAGIGGSGMGPGGMGGSGSGMGSGSSGSGGNGYQPNNQGGGRRMMGSGMGPGGPVGGAGDMGGPGGPSQGVMRSSDSIIIRNLPVDCNWQALRDGFSHCGEIKYAEMKERTTGFIRFTSERDAERAVSMMDKHVIGNRTIDVQLY